ncbi:MAG: phosphoglycerate kinase [Nanobdellota archaeon]
MMDFNDIKKVQDVDLKDKRVFLRLDLNVPLDDNGVISSDFRIRNALPTIQHILEQSPKQLILASHLGRPNGKRMSTLSLHPVLDRLEEYLEQPVYFHQDIYEQLPSSSRIVLFENLRFYEGEKKGDLDFAKQLSSFADVYVNDAFGTAHRKDASVYQLPQLLPSSAGLLIEKELEHVSLDQNHPIIAIFGPAKIADKLPLFHAIASQVDKIILAGGVVFTFMKAIGLEVGSSLVENDMLSQAEWLFNEYREKLVFPEDFLVTAPSYLNKIRTVSSFDGQKHISVCSSDDIPAFKSAYDIGPESVNIFSTLLHSAKTVVWNGPLGLFEVPPFDTGTRRIARLIAESSMTSIVCGGDTAAALRQTPYKNDMTHISTGGGASLQLLSGQKLPALEVLKK